MSTKKTDIGAAELVEKAEKVREILKTLADDELHRKFQLGEIASQIKGNYGNRSVKRLAEASGCTEQDLYRSAKVYEAWPALDFLKSKGLSFSHYAEVAKAKDKAERDELLEACKTENLSVRDLKRLMSGTKPPTRAIEEEVEQRPSCVDVMKRIDEELKAMVATDIASEEKADVLNAVVSIKKRADAIAQRVLERSETLAA